MYSTRLSPVHNPSETALQNVLAGTHCRGKTLLGRICGNQTGSYSPLSCSAVQCRRYLSHSLASLPADPITIHNARGTVAIRFLIAGSVTCYERLARKRQI